MRTTGRSLLAALAVLALASTWAAAQDNAGSPLPYKPPPRGKPGGTVTAATRGTVKITTPLPEIALIAPDGESGETVSPSPTLYFYVSLPVRWPTRFAISAPWQAEPVVDTAVVSPAAAGIYAVRLADLRVRLEPGIVYTWSVSVLTDPIDPARDLVGSATLLRVPADPALDAAAAAAPGRRAALLAQAGLWYDAVAAAAENGDAGLLGALIHQVGLAAPASLAPMPLPPLRQAAARR